MALLQQFQVWSSKIGDLLLGSAQAGAIGASFGNGAATFGTNAANPNQMGDDGMIAFDNPSSPRTPSATAGDRILSLMTIPAFGFDQANRSAQISAYGNCPNANSKTMKIIVNPTAPVLGAVVSGGTTIASFTSTATGGWYLGAIIAKYGGLGSNTQNCVHEAAQVGGTVGALVAPQQGTTFPENTTMTIAITGNASTSTADVAFTLGSIFATN